MVCIMDEFDFIEEIKQKTYHQSGLMKGVGDDAAVFRQTSNDIVTAVDMFVEGVHFSNATMDAYHIGYKVLAVNVSDVAAMGATPRYYMVSIACPDSYSDPFYKQIYHGMRDFASTYKMDLIGGDTVSGKELAISVTVIGTVPAGKARYRNQARPNDIVFVTGTLGDSQAGLHILLNQLEAKGKDYFISKHQQPEPHVEFAKGMRNIKRLALNDISDGIASELNEIAASSDVSIELFRAYLPVSKHYNQFPQHLQRKWMLFGGEDFELVGTVSKEDWETVKEIAENTGTKVTKIGHAIRRKHSSGNVFLLENDQRVPLNKGGYTHLK